MKKICSIVLAVVMASAMAACSDAKTISSSGTSGASGGTTTTAAQSQDGGNGESSADGNGQVDLTIDTTGNFVFAYEGVDILLGADPDAVLEGLGDPKSYLEVPSCAHDGTDHVYTYTNMVLTVYIPTGSDKGYISDVLVTSDLVSTPEGLEIGMSADDAREKYGDPDKDDDVSFVYTRGTSQLLITLSAGSIISIEYMIP
ncbi:MAG: hypothetical protein J6Y08_03055 [Clostridiales bacterium]|nr:hypothetical protein [Clostridiales bacterium]